MHVCGTKYHVSLLQLVYYEPIRNSVACGLFYPPLTSVGDGYAITANRFISTCSTTTGRSTISRRAFITRGTGTRTPTTVSGARAAFTSTYRDQGCTTRASTAPQGSRYRNPCCYGLSQFILDGDPCQRLLVTVPLTSTPLAAVFCPVRCFLRS